MGHGEGAEDFALAEDVEGFSGDAFECCAENDESDIAVFGAGGGIGREGSGEGGAEQVFAGVGVQE